MLGWLVACTRPVNTGSGCTGLNFVFCLLVLCSFYCTACHCALNSYLLTYRGVCYGHVSVRLSGRPSYTGIVLKQLNELSCFFPQRLPSIYLTLHFMKLVISETSTYCTFGNGFQNRNLAEFSTFFAAARRPSLVYHIERPPSFTIRSTWLRVSRGFIFRAHAQRILSL